MAELSFHGGLGVIGGTKILIESTNARVLLDLGLDIPSGADLFRAPVGHRAGRELADLVLARQAPRLAGFFDPEDLAAARRAAPDLVATLSRPDPRESAVFVSHAHIDHDGLAPFLRPDVPAYASTGTVRLHDALDVCGLQTFGRSARLRPMPGAGPSSGWAPLTAPLDGDAAHGSSPARERCTVGDLTVERLDVDHDVPGASGYIVTTLEGARLAYTGDINLHRDGGRRSREFARAAAGSEALVIETTLLSFDPLPGPPAGEAQVEDTIASVLQRDPGLVLLSVYERDLQRAQRVIDLAATHERTLVWPGRQAAFLTLCGVRGVATWDASRPQRGEQLRALDAAARAGATPARRVGLDQVWERPGDFVVQLDPDDDAALLDLPTDACEHWVHSQGEPLGPFMAQWAPFMDWLEHAGIELVPAGSSGHGDAAALRELVEIVGPKVVYPVHGFRPHILADLAPAGVEVVVPQPGSVYPL